MTPTVLQHPARMIWLGALALSQGAFGSLDLRTGYYSVAQKMMATEAVEAVRRFKGPMFDGISAAAAPFKGILDPLICEADLRSFAKAQGLDFDSIVRGAARHFASSEIIRRTEPLSREELGCLFEDDQRALDR